MLGKNVLLKLLLPQKVSLKMEFCFSLLVICGLSQKVKCGRHAFYSELKVMFILIAYHILDAYCNTTSHQVLCTYYFI